MRNLTIKRTKSLVACLAKIKIYIEDPTSNEISINGISCRKLGDLKNGEEKTFSIGNEAAKVFVIADKLSKNICNEFYPLPEGEDDISLSGKNKFNLATGNSFRFDNNDSEAATANRKKSVKHGALVMITAVILGIAVGLYIGFVLNAPKEKTFSAQGMSITLTDEFHRFNEDGYVAIYDSKDVAVFVSRFDILETQLSEFAELLAVRCGLASTDVKTTDGLTHFTFTNTGKQNKVEYQYTVYLYKTGDTFWTVEFATRTKDAGDYADKIQEWVKSVKFEA